MGIPGPKRGRRRQVLAPLTADLRRAVESEIRFVLKRLEKPIRAAAGAARLDVDDVKQEVLLALCEGAAAWARGPKTHLGWFGLRAGRFRLGTIVKAAGRRPPGCRLAADQADYRHGGEPLALRREWFSAEDWLVVRAYIEEGGYNPAARRLRCSDGKVVRRLSAAIASARAALADAPADY